LMQVSKMPWSSIMLHTTAINGIQRESRWMAKLNPKALKVKALAMSLSTLMSRRSKLWRTLWYLASLKVQRF
jgi:hypothetical protein